MGVFGEVVLGITYSVNKNQAPVYVVLLEIEGYGSFKSNVNFHVIEMKVKKTTKCETPD